MRTNFFFARALDMFNKNDVCVISGETRKELEGKEIRILGRISEYMPDVFTNDDLWMQKMLGV